MHNTTPSSKPCQRNNEGSSSKSNTRRDERPTLEEWLEAWPALERVGSGAEGECPVCRGGDSRSLMLHVNADGLVGCRGCIDGLPDDKRARAYGKIIQAVFGREEGYFTRNRKFDIDKAALEMLKVKDEGGTSEESVEAVRKIATESNLSVNEHELAKNFNRLHGQHFVLDESSTLQRWTGNGWEPDKRRILTDLTQFGHQYLGSRDQEGAWKSNPAKGGSYATANNTRRLLEAGHFHHVTQEESDAPGYIGLPNGRVWDRVILSDRDAHAFEYILSGLAAEPDPDGWRDSEWHEFLLECGVESDDLKQLQILIGAAALGEAATTERSLAIIHGRKNSGKSTFNEAIGRTFGSYRTAIGRDFLTRKRFTDTSNLLGDQIAKLRGKRLATGTEWPKNGVVDNDLVKALKSGEQIEGRRLRESTITFTNRALILVTTNRHPEFDEPDPALFDRLRVWEFNRQSDENKQDGLIDKLTTPKGLQTISAWILEGAMLYCTEGFRPTERMRQVQREWMDNADHIGLFIKEHVVITGNRNDTVSSYLLYDAFTKSTEQKDISNQDKKDLKRRLEDAGATFSFRVNDTMSMSRVRGFHGVKLSSY